MTEKGEGALRGKGAASIFKDQAVLGKNFFT